MARNKDLSGALMWATLLFEDRNHYVDELVFGRPYRANVPYYLTRDDTGELIGDLFDDVYIEELFDEEGGWSIWRCVIHDAGQHLATAYGDFEQEALCFAALRAKGVYVVRR